LRFPHLLTDPEVSSQPALLRPQRPHGLSIGGSPGWNHCGDKCRNRKHDGGYHHYHWIMWFHSIQLACHHAPPKNRNRDSNGQTDADL
jgi:hypothetical protein